MLSCNIHSTDILQIEWRKTWDSFRFVTHYFEHDYKNVSIHIKGLSSFQKLIKAELSWVWTKSKDMWIFLLIFSQSLFCSAEISKNGGGQYVFSKLNEFIFHGNTCILLEFLSLESLNLEYIFPHFSTFWTETMKIIMQN